MRLRRRKQLTWQEAFARAEVASAILMASLRRLGAAGVTAAEATRAFGEGWRKLAWRDPSPFAFFDAPLTKSMAEIAAGASE